jgi:hypothetical protein
MHRDVSLARINRVPISNFPAAKIAGKYKEVDKVGEGKYGYLLHIKTFKKALFIRLIIKLPKLTLPSKK